MGHAAPHCRCAAILNSPVCPRAFSPYIRTLHTYTYIHCRATLQSFTANPYRTSRTLRCGLQCPQWQQSCVSKAFFTAPQRVSYIVSKKDLRGARQQSAAIQHLGAAYSRSTTKACQGSSCRAMCIATGSTSLRELGTKPYTYAASKRVRKQCIATAVVQRLTQTPSGCNGMADSDSCASRVVTGCGPSHAALRS